MSIGTSLSTTDLRHGGLRCDHDVPLMEICYDCMRAQSAYENMWWGGQVTPLAGYPKEMAAVVDETIMQAGSRRSNTVTTTEEWFPELWNAVLGSELPSLFEILSDQEVELQAAKRADYTGGGRILANYEEAARATGLKTWQVMLSRIYEKLYRFRMLREKGEGEVEDETLVDTLLDVAILAKLLIIEKEDTSG